MEIERTISTAVERKGCSRKEASTRGKLRTVVAVCYGKVSASQDLSKGSKGVGEPQVGDGAGYLRAAIEAVTTKAQTMARMPDGETCRATALVTVATV